MLLAGLALCLALIATARIARAQPAARGTYEPKPPTRRVTVPLQGTPYQLTLGENDGSTWKQYKADAGWAGLELVSSGSPHLWIKMVVAKMSCDGVFTTLTDKKLGVKPAPSGWAPSGWRDDVVVMDIGLPQAWLCADDTRRHLALVLVATYEVAWKERAARVEISGVATALLTAYLQNPPPAAPAAQPEPTPQPVPAPQPEPTPQPAKRPAPQTIVQQLQSGILATTFPVEVQSNRRWQRRQSPDGGEAYTSEEETVTGLRNSVNVRLTRLPAGMSCSNYLRSLDHGQLARYVRPNPPFLAAGWGTEWISLDDISYFCIDNVRPGLVAAVNVIDADTLDYEMNGDDYDLVHVGIEATTAAFLRGVLRAANARPQAKVSPPEPASSTDSYGTYVDNHWSRPRRKYGRGVRTDLMFLGTNFYDTRPYFDFRLQLLHSIKGGHSLVYGFELASGTGSGISFGGDGSLALGWGVSYPRLNLFVVATGGDDAITGDMVQDVGAAGYVGTRAGIRAYAPKMVSFYAHAAALWRFDHTDRELRLDGGMLVGNRRGFLFGGSLRSFNNGNTAYSINLGMFL